MRFRSMTPRRVAIFAVAIAVAGSAAYWLSASLSSATYANEELGIPAAVDSYLRQKEPWTDTGPVPPKSNSNAVTGTETPESQIHAQERAWFELSMRQVLSDAAEALEGELDWYRGTLAREWHRAMDECALEHGYEAGYSAFSDVPEHIGDELPKHSQSLLEVRSQCARWAASYPGLEVSRRDELLHRTEQRLEMALSNWIRENPSVVVPVEWHPGAPAPLTDSIRRTCRASEYPLGCARESGIDLAE